MMGVGCFGFLAGLTAVGVGVMVGGLTVASKLGLGLSAVWASVLAFHLVQVIGLMFHYLKVGPLAVKTPAAATSVAEVQCIEVPSVGEVCVVAEDDDASK